MASKWETISENLPAVPWGAQFRSPDSLVISGLPKLFQSPVSLKVGCVSVGGAYAAWFTLASLPVEVFIKE